MQRNVLVVGDNDLAGLAAVRSLGQAGLDVHLVAFEASPITRASRFVRKIHRLGHPLVDPDGFAKRLLDLIQRCAFDLVLPTSDKALVPLMAWREQIARYSGFAVPTAEAFRITHCKEETVALAARLGVAVPRTQVIRHQNELMEPFGFPLVLKPSSSVRTGTAERNEVRIVRSANELESRLPKLLARGPVLVQEFCPGYGIGLNVLARAGELLAAFQHERVHEPPEGGASSYRKSVPLSPNLLDNARRLCTALRWTGPAMLEFKVDPSTGRAALMEINGRLWGSLALAIQAGVDFPRMIYDLYVHGRVRPKFKYQTSFHVRHTVRDVYWLRANFAAPAGRKDLLRKSLPEVVSEVGTILRGQEGYDLEALTDPIPGLLAWMQLSRELTRGIGHRLARYWYRWLAWRKVQQVRRQHRCVAEQLRGARSVLFVCLGNINRSAVAAAALQQHDTGLAAASAGLLPRGGRRTSDVSQRVAHSLGIDLVAHRSVPLTAELLRKHDLILVMEAEHFQGVRRLCPEALAKTWPLAAFCARGSSTITDPEGADAETFLLVYRRVIQAVAGLVQQLTPSSAPKSQSEPGPGGFSPSPAGRICVEP